MVSVLYRVNKSPIQVTSWEGCFVVVLGYIYLVSI